MLLLLPIILSFAAGFFTPQAAWAESAAKAGELIPETDIGRVVVSITTAEPGLNWVASAHEDHIRHILSQSPRLLLFTADSVKLASCEDFACQRQVLKNAQIDLYLEGKLLSKELQLRAVVPETEIELSNISIRLGSHTTPEQVKSGIMQAMKPFTEAGGILDQRTALRRAEKKAADHHGPVVAIKTLGTVLAAIALIVLVAIIIALIIFPDGRRSLAALGALWLVFALGPLWLISEELALVKPVAIFAIPDPWVLAILGGLGSGGALWGLCLRMLPQLRGLETIKQTRMPLVMGALGIITAYRSMAFMIWAMTAASIIIAVQLIFGLDTVHTVAISLVVVGGLATLSALVFEVLAQVLDRRLVSGRANRENIWHIKVTEALRGHPHFAELSDIFESILILPTTLDKPLAYGGGLSAPRILVPELALEKAFATRPEDLGQTYDFLVGLILNGMAKVCVRSHLDATLGLSMVRKATMVRMHGKTLGFFSSYRRTRQLLEGDFLAVHKGHQLFIQYLYWKHKPDSQLLTVRANPGQLNEITQSILDKVGRRQFTLVIDNPRDHIRWLAETYIHRHPETSAKPIPPKRRPRKVMLIVVLTIFFGYHIVSAALYRPVYVERIAQQRAKIEEKKHPKKEEDLAHVPEPQPAKVNEEEDFTSRPDPGAISAAGPEVVAKVAPAKPKKKLKPKPRKARKKSKLKPKPKLRPAKKSESRKPG